MLCAYGGAGVAADASFVAHRGWAGALNAPLCRSGYSGWARAGSALSSSSRALWWAPRRRSTRTCEQPPPLKRAHTQSYLTRFTALGVARPRRRGGEAGARRVGAATRGGDEGDPGTPASCLAAPPPPADSARDARLPPVLQVISEVLHWTREPGRLRALAARKVALVASRLASRARPRAPPPGLVPFLERLRAHGTPCALASSEPASVVSSALEATQLAPFFSAVVTGEDMERGRPDPDGYLYASQRLGRPPARCLLIGCSNASVEAARDAGMRCVAVAGAATRFELAAADCVVSRLDELTMQNLQQMFAVEEPRPQPEAMAEAEEQEQEEDDGGDLWGSNLY